MLNALANHLINRKKPEPVFAGAASTNCHWSPTICGAGEVTFTQVPKARFVRDCNVKPSLASGHENVRFVPVSVKLMDGRGESATWAALPLSPAGFNAETT